MLEAPIIVIETKKQRKLFEEVESSKMLGYFEKGSTGKYRIDKNNGPMDQQDKNSLINNAILVQA